MVQRWLERTIVVVKIHPILKSVGLFIMAVCLIIMSMTTRAAQAADLGAAQKALFNGDYDMAANLFTAAIANADLKCNALYGLGVTKLRSLQYDDANAAFTRALTECPPTFNSYALRGDARRALGKNSDAF